jgi:hypothetical protein
MTAPTDAEMIAWLRDCAIRAEARGLLGDDASKADAAMLRAIAARLRTPPAAGLAHEAPGYESMPEGVVAPVFGREK